VPKEATSSNYAARLKGAQLFICHNYGKWLLFEGLRKLERAAAGGWNFNTAIVNSIKSTSE